MRKRTGRWIARGEDRKAGLVAVATRAATQLNDELPPLQRASVRRVLENVGGTGLLEACERRGGPQRLALAAPIGDGDAGREFGESYGFLRILNLSGCCRFRCVKRDGLAMSD